MNRLLLAAGLAGGALIASPAYARERMSDEQLDSHRAGFMTPTGVEIGLGADVRTYVDGQLALETRLTWTDQGVTREVIAGQETQDVQAAAARLGLDLTGDWKGVVIEQPGGGASAALTTIGRDAVGNLLVNTASDQDLRLETEITVMVADFEGVQQQFLQEQATMNLHDAIGTALQGF